MTNEPNRLPTVTYKGKEYFIDIRLKEFRPVDMPFESIAFDSELGREIDEMPEPEEAPSLASNCISIECPGCKKTLFRGTEKGARQHVTYCADCSRED